VGGFLCLLLNNGRVLTPISRHYIPPDSKREIHGYKVPSTYTTDFLQVLLQVVNFKKLVIKSCNSITSFSLDANGNKCVGMRLLKLVPSILLKTFLSEVVFTIDKLHANNMQMQGAFDKSLELLRPHSPILLKFFL
jgi:hypothetical protein